MEISAGSYGVILRLVVGEWSTSDSVTVGSVITDRMHYGRAAVVLDKTVVKLFRRARLIRPGIEVPAAFLPDGGGRG
ncbi:hypothetical protein [Crossiella sp. CA198]|uniref:hypothetical protein n=1 Tax=Crossiella sp. CA198 TaxID=3455607 RepID=UPI003F8D4D38